MIYSTTTAATALNCSRETVRRIAQRLGLGVTIRGAITLSDADLAAIRPEIQPIGNPKMVAGNDLWRLRKKRKKPARKTR